MNRSSKFNFYLPQNTDPISVSDFNYNFEVIDDNLITEEQSWTSSQKEKARTNIGCQVDSKANKNAPISYFSLIDRVAITKTATNYTFYNNRSLASYPTISIQPIIGGYFRQGIVIPRNHFNNTSAGKFSFTIYSGGEHVEIVLNYVDDYQISMKYNATGTFNVEIIIDGLVNGAG